MSQAHEDHGHTPAAWTAVTIMFLVEGSRFLKDVIYVFDATQLAALRLILIGLGLILFLIYRPQGILPEYRLRVHKRGRPGVSAPAEVHHSS